MNKLWIPVAGAVAVGLAALAWRLPPNPASATREQTLTTAPAAQSAASPRPRAQPPLAHAAPDFARELDSATLADNANRRGLEAWAQKDPAAALAWAAGILDLAQRDPRKAVQAAIDTRLCDTDAGLLDNLTAQWADRDFAGAHDWVRQQEAGDWHEELTAHIAFICSKSDPAAAAQIVVEEMTPGPRQDEAAISVLHQWAQSDLEAAAAWANAFPEGNLHRRALAEIEGIRKSSQMAAAQP
jgi:hypothetical protein